MAKRAAYRGPYGIYEWLEGAVGFAHLASEENPENIHQPLVRDGFVVTAHARVDNRDDLIPLLKSKGYLAGTDPTSQELILASYHQWGVEAPRHLIGDFAYVIWDREQRQLFAARDPVAMRPFYYYRDTKRFLFASEVKQLLTVPGVPKRPNEAAIAAHLIGISGPLNWTFYEGIEQLAPGHALLVNANGARSWRYWDIDPEKRLRYRRDQDYAEHFRALFLEAVRCRLGASGSAGLFLSGGTDSGSIASTIGWLRLQNPELPQLRTYSWAFKEFTQCDERDLSAVIAERYGLSATAIPADDAWPLSDYPEGGPDQDEPFIGLYQALYIRGLQAAQADGIRHMFSGDGGDAAVGGGYHDYAGLLRAGQVGRAYQELNAQSELASGSRLRTLKNYVSLTLSLTPKAERLLAAKRRAEPYSEWLSPALVERVRLDELVEESVPSIAVRDTARQMRYRMLFWPIDLRGAVWMERLRARFGMEHLEPWTDRRIMEFVMAVPQWRLTLPSETKRVVRQAMVGMMPEEVRRGSRKIFALPLYRKAARETARPVILELLSNARVAELGYVDSARLEDGYGAICRHERGLQGLWEVLTLEMWLRKYW